MMRRPTTVPLLLLAAACAPGGPPTQATPAPALAHAMPASPTLRYELADTGGFVMDIPGMGAAPIDMATRVTADLAYAAGGDSLRVTATVNTLSGSFSSPAGAPVNVGDAQKPGPATLHVAPDGGVRFVNAPSFRGALAQVTSPAALYNAFFVRLPGRAVTRGALWTDTVRTTEEQGGMQSVVTQIIRSTWARDSIVDGQSLALITSEISTEMQISGESQGVEVRQSLQGTSAATALWDPVGRFLVYRVEQGTTSGMADLPGLGMNGIPVRGQARQVVRRITR